MSKKRTIAVSSETWKLAKRIVVDTGESIMAMIGRLVKAEAARLNIDNANKPGI